LIDKVHSLDPNHPVIYREAEIPMVPTIVDALKASGDMRPWFLYGTNIYGKDPSGILDAWPAFGLDRPLVVSEFGWDAPFGDGRAQGYLAMWRAIRARSTYVMGGAPYVWTVKGPEPVDAKWGLMSPASTPVDATFGTLSAAWLT